MNLKLNPLFTDGMVLQRNASLSVFGECKPNDVVSVKLCGKSFTATADGNGRWTCRIGEYNATSTPLDMTISAADEQTAIQDILIGDVWLCSGQSNMELMLNRVRHNYPDELLAENPLIRQCKVPQVYNFSAPQAELSECSWESFSPQTAENFTAAGYFFAKKLYERYNVPVGLFAAAVGGTPVAAWLSADMLKAFPDELSEEDKCGDKYISDTCQAYEVYSKSYHESLDQADLGLQENWAEAQYDDKDWDEVTILEPITQSGAYWYRKTLQIPSEMQGRQAAIFLGTATDMDEVFINGRKIGQTDYRYPPREYCFELPECSTLTISIRLLCFNGKGGFTAGKNYFLATSNATIDIGENWKRRTGILFEDKRAQPFFQYQPTGLYNGMIAPLLAYSIKGIIWYQGESDTARPERYAEKLMTLISGWRELFGQDDLPFLLTQLAYFEDTNGIDWDLLRAAQKKCLALPCTGLALAHDLGEGNDLHPQNKRDIGERLARLAMRIAYGETLPPNLFEMYNVTA